MKSLRFLPAAALFVLLMGPTSAFARGGPLKHPALALPPDLAGREQIMAVISDGRFQFVGGVFLNASSSLRYQGKAAAVNDFVARLAACPGAKVQVSFQDNDDAADWTLLYDSSKAPHVLRVIVNTRRVERAAVWVP